MPEFHAEPYLHLAGLSHKSALIAWGAFYFKTRSRHADPKGPRGAVEWKLKGRGDMQVWFLVGRKSAAAVNTA